MNKQLDETGADKQQNSRDTPSGVVCMYKNLGETPLQALDRLRKEKPELKNISLSYAGRLDPLAEGIILVVVGDENKADNKAKYLHLDKEYEVEIVFGVSTDTYDLLGKITHVSENIFSDISQENFLDKIKTISKKYVGEITQTYPLYSSKVFNKDYKKIHAKTQAENFDENVDTEIQENIPKKNIKIYSLEINSCESISLHELADAALKKIQKVTGDFRQQEIEKGWHNLKSQENKEFFKIRIHVQCSSGAYMRSLAHEFGRELKTGAVAYSIVRTRIGNYTSALST